VTASAVLLSPRLQHHSSIRWQAGCGAQGRQARAPQSARQLLFSPQPADTVSDKPAADREPNWLSAEKLRPLDFLMAAVKEQADLAKTRAEWADLTPPVQSP
jgi:hypothetical protein